jgi:hypothetical protein
LYSSSTSISVDEVLLSDCFIYFTQLHYYYHYYVTRKETLSLNEDSYHLHQIQMNPIHFFTYHFTVNAFGTSYDDVGLATCESFFKH